MKQKPQNYQRNPTTALEATVTEQVFDKLDRLTLNKAFIEQDLVELADPPPKSSVPIEKAVYITEIDGEFLLLDYRVSINEEPIPFASFGNSAASGLATNSVSSFKPKSIKNSGLESFLSGKKGLMLGAGLGVLLTLGASRLFLTPKADTTNNDAQSTVTEVATPAQTVTVTEVATTDINNQLDASGTVIAYESTPVMSQAASLQITEVLAERGDFVERGQVLAKLNNRAILAQKTEAEGSVAQVQARLDELQAGSRVEEIAQAQARVDNAKSAISQSESNLELVQKRVERNRNLEEEGAITRDSFDEVLNEERVTKSQLSQAKASLAEAQQALAQLKAGSRPQTIAQAKAELAQAQGRLEGIEAQLADTTIIAPTSGIISSREAKVGQITSTSEMLFSIIENGRLELRLRVPETLIGKIQVGQQVEITSNRQQNLALTGKVREIEPTIDDSSRQATVKVELPSGENLKPGMFLQAKINTSTNPGQAVPIEALLPQSGNKAIAFVVQDDNTVKAKTVTMGEVLSGQRIEIVEGLNPGDRLVLKGAAYLKDGDTVKIAKN